MTFHHTGVALSLPLVVALGPAAACEPEAEELARSTLEQGGATVLECPGSIQIDEGESTAICAVVDGDLEAFRAAWNEAMVAAGGIEASNPDETSRRTGVFIVGQSLLTLKDRGGALVMSCSGSAPADASSVTSQPETSRDDERAPSETPATTGTAPPESSNVTDPEKFRKMVGRALAAAACKVFECPESMRSKLDGEEVICAVCDGTLSEFSRDFGGGPIAAAAPLGEWTRSAPHDRKYEVAGAEVAVRFNGGAVSVTYIPPEPLPAGEAGAE